MLFLMCLAFGACLLALARRRAGTIRLRVERRWGERPPASWEAWHHATRQPRSDRNAWWREPYESDAVAGTAATVWVTFPEDLCIQVGVR